MIGTKLAQYKVTAALGEGGMGQVWRAEDEKLGREVALKMLPQEFAEDPERMARFEREAKASANLKHLNILDIIDFGRDDDGSHYIVMEYVQGRSLSEIIKSDGPLAPARVADGHRRDRHHPGYESHGQSRDRCDDPLGARLGVALDRTLDHVTAEGLLAA